eukprot:c5650_g1_i2.p1 GENE.c5650_g1_i2~~c5650_g1_i2.p1  ORF type:complete len:238 (+),score=30.39 c5650_g1_i2:1-714(+)
MGVILAQMLVRFAGLRQAVLKSWVDTTCQVSRLHTGVGSVDPYQIALNTLSPVPGSRKPERRVGRGPGGRGKTCGKGTKGQKQKTHVHPSFEGGQTPLARRLPKRGFTNPASRPMNPLNLDTLQFYADTGRLDLSKPIDLKTLRDLSIVGKIKHGVKLLARGASWFKAPIQIEVTAASEKAVKAVESCGGTVTTRFFNDLGLRAHLTPSKFGAYLPAQAKPKPKYRHKYPIEEAPSK